MPRRRGKIFKDFKLIETSTSDKNANLVVHALGILNANLLLIMELLADIRKNQEGQPLKEMKKDNDSNS